MAVIREQRDADARGDVVILAADIHRQLQRIDDALRDGTSGIRIRNVAQDHRELVATQTRDGIAILHAGAQALRDDDEQLIARRVPDGVVHALEVIEVDVQQRAAPEPGGRASRAPESSRSRNSRRFGSDVSGS